MHFSQTIRSPGLAAPLEGEIAEFDLDPSLGRQLSEIGSRAMTQVASSAPKYSLARHASSR